MTDFEVHRNPPLELGLGVKNEAAVKQVSDKGLVCSIYKELSRLKSKETTNNLIKNAQKI